MQEFSFKPFRITTVLVEKKTKQNKHANVKTWTIMHATRHYQSFLQFYKVLKVLTTKKNVFKKTIQ